MDYANAYRAVDLLRDNVETVIVGKRSVVDLAITCLLADGHLLVEDVPGVGKSMLAKSIAKSVDASAKRIQFTPDLLPSDITGASIYNQKDHSFSFREGPVFANIVLADEINRGNGPDTPGSFLVMLVDFLLDRASSVIEDLYDQVDELEDAVLVESNYHQREQLAGIRRQAIALRRFLAPQREALNRLSAERSPLLNDADHLHLREGFDRLTRLVEDLDAARERASVTHESLVSRIAEQTNQRMYVLSIVAAIFLPLSFVTGLLGINVGGIPGADSALGFPAVIVLMLVIAAGICALFRWRRWC